ncbi:MAG: hypothetical protein IJ640_07165 [Prevotella sp.]|nr:hypothetical protein [Prevotella sp.]
MRVIGISDAAMNITGTASIPDEVSYVFNPNYVNINFGTKNDVMNLSITDGTDTYDIEVSLFNGKAKCYISKLMQLFFTDYISTRSKELTIILKVQSGETIMSMPTMALWASVEQGKKYGYYMPFVYDRGKYPKYVREVIWFKNFPFRVSLFRRTKNYNMYAKSDNNIPKAIYTGTDVSWSTQSGGASGDGPRGMRKASRIINGETAAQIIETPAMQTLDLGLLAEAGMEVDLQATGISDISQLSDMSLKDVVVRRRSSRGVREYVWMDDDGDGYDDWAEWDDYIDSGLDIITYFSIWGGKTGILEFSPASMFPYTTKQLVYTIMKDVPLGAMFDANFDIVFDEMTSLAYIVKLTVCEDKDGLYLRWIDQYGFWQYFLFSEGTLKSKNSLSKVTIDAEYEQNGIYHGATRNAHVDNTDTIKCCAVNLKEEILAYVETIYKSPHVEMYIGKDFEDNEMWKPVNIVSGNVERSQERNLYDYEISITLPNTVSQTI